VVAWAVVVLVAFILACFFGSIQKAHFADISYLNGSSLRFLVSFLLPFQRRWANGLASGASSEFDSALSVCCTKCNLFTKHFALELDLCGIEDDKRESVSPTESFSQQVQDVAARKNK
jgi:hypothetical protein